MKMSKSYRKLKLMRSSGNSFIHPNEGHYEVEREHIMLPITLAENYNSRWQESGVYFEEIPEIEEEVIPEFEEQKQTTFRKPTNAEIRAKAKELGFEVKTNSKIDDMLNYIREKQNGNNN